MPKNIDEKEIRIKKLKCYFRKRKGVVLAYVFGSTISGTEHRESDVDVAVLLGPNLTKQDRFDARLKIGSELAKLLRREVDVVVLNDIRSLLLQYTVVHEGILLFEARAGERAEFESALLGRFFDFQPFLDAYNAHYVKNESKS